MSVFENSQWKLTDSQLESTEPLVMASIPLTDLLRIRTVGDHSFYEWPVHFAEKSWVDLDAFIEAFCKAVDLNAARLPVKFDRKLFDLGVLKARLKRAGKAP